MSKSRLERIKSFSNFGVYMCSQAELSIRCNPWMEKTIAPSSMVQQFELFQAVWIASTILDFRASSVRILAWARISSVSRECRSRASPSGFHLDAMPHRAFPASIVPRSDLFSGHAGMASCVLINCLRRLSIFQFFQNSFRRDSALPFQDPPRISGS